MKKMKLFAFIGLMVLGLTACLGIDELSRFERQASQSMNTVERFDEEDVATLDQEVELVSEVQLMSINLSTSTLDTEKVALLRTLIQSIVETRFENVSIHEDNQLAWEALKTDIQTFRAQELSLNEDDKIVMQALRADLVDTRNEVRETIGDVRDLLIELRGNWNLDNIDLIIENLTEVLRILELRQTFLNQIDGAIDTVHQIVLTHLS